MPIEKFRWLAGLIAAHKDRKVFGRTRLQKEVRLLQRCGFPTRYRYTIYFYGPYSEGLQSEVALLDQIGLVNETEDLTQDGKPYFILEAQPDAELPEVGPYRPQIDLLAEKQSTILELAATYDAFRELGFDHDKSMQRLREKKGAKCDDGRDQLALNLLGELGLKNH